MVAKIHAYKFKNFSTNILKITPILLILLIILSILWYITIFFIDDTNMTFKIDKSKKTFNNSNWVEY